MFPIFDESVPGQEMGAAQEKIDLQGSALAAIGDVIADSIGEALTFQQTGINKVGAAIRRWVCARVKQQGQGMIGLLDSLISTITNRLAEQQVKLNIVAGRLPIESLGAGATVFGSPRPPDESVTVPFSDPNDIRTHGTVTQGQPVQPGTIPQSPIPPQQGVSPYAVQPSTTPQKPRPPAGVSPSTIVQRPPLPPRRGQPPSGPIVPPSTLPAPPPRPVFPAPIPQPKPPVQPGAVPVDPLQPLPPPLPTPPSTLPFDPLQPLPPPLPLPPTTIPLPPPIPIEPPSPPVEPPIPPVDIPVPPVEPPIEPPTEPPTEPPLDPVVVSGICAGIPEEAAASQHVVYIKPWGAGVGGAASVESECGEKLIEEAMAKWLPVQQMLDAMQYDDWPNYYLPNDTGFPLM